jgi:hypothetical protein
VTLPPKCPTPHGSQPPAHTPHTILCLPCTWRQPPAHTPHTIRCLPCTWRQPRCPRCQPLQRPPPSLWVVRAPRRSKHHPYLLACCNEASSVLVHKPCTASTATMRPPLSTMTLSHHPRQPPCSLANQLKTWQYLMTTTVMHPRIPRTRLSLHRALPLLRCSRHLLLLRVRPPPNQGNVTLTQYIMTVLWNCQGSAAYKSGRTRPKQHTR